jgi:hypothetical protein
LHRFGGFFLLGKTLKWESGDFAIARKSGAVPAAVSPF